MVEERIGEYMGPVDWSYDFASHFTGCSDREERCKQAVEWLTTLDANPRDYEATTDGGCRGAPRPGDIPGSQGCSDLRNARIDADQSPSQHVVVSRLLHGRLHCS